MEEKLKKAFQKIKEAKNILIATHDRPDGDGLSSLCFLICLLKSLNKKYIAFCKDAPPSNFNFLPFVDEIASNKNLIDFKQYDLIIAVDCGSLKRTNLTQEINLKNQNQFIIEIDHHPQVEKYADLEIRDVKFCSTSEIFYFFAKQNKINLNKDLATCVLTGILTDTGNFLYSSTTPEAINIASEMLRYGIQFPLIIGSTWRNKSLSAMKVWGMAIDNLEINNKYNFAFSVLPNNIISESGISDDELDGVAGFLNNLYGVSGIMLLRQEGAKLRGSLRSGNLATDVSKLAFFLGGGGHKKASGFVVDGKLEKKEGCWQIV